MSRRWGGLGLGREEAREGNGGWGGGLKVGDVGDAGDTEVWGGGGGGDVEENQWDGWVGGW